MRINLSGSFLISVIMHSLLFSVIFVIPPSEIKEEAQKMDISFMFNDGEDKLQSSESGASRELLPEKTVSVKQSKVKESPPEVSDNLLVSSMSEEKIGTDEMTQSVVEVSERLEMPDNTTAQLDLSSTFQQGISPTWEDLLNTHSGKVRDESGGETHIAQGIAKMDEVIHHAEPTAQGGTQKTISSLKEFGTQRSGLQENSILSGESESPEVNGVSSDEGSGVFELSGIVDGLINSIESRKVYPYIARRKGIEGNVIVFIELDRDGGLVNIDIKKSSGHKILDESAISLINSVCPFRHGAGKNIKVKLPITYSLFK